MPEHSLAYARLSAHWPQGALLHCVGWDGCHPAANKCAPSILQSKRSNDIIYTPTATISQLLVRCCTTGSHQAAGTAPKLLPTTCPTRQAGRHMGWLALRPLQAAAHSPCCCCCYCCCCCCCMLLHSALASSSCARGRRAAYLVAICAAIRSAASCTVEIFSAPAGAGWKRGQHWGIKQDGRQVGWG
jgi:hypothetical protein